MNCNLFSLSSSKSSLQEICNLSFVELPKFRKLNFYFNKFVNCNFLSLHCQAQSSQTQQTKLIQIFQQLRQILFNSILPLKGHVQENLTLFIIQCNITSSIFLFFSPFPFFPISGQVYSIIVT